VTKDKLTVGGETVTALSQDFCAGEAEHDTREYVECSVLAGVLVLSARWL
jgi:hypothetical protein